jgi:sortase (surface protein transpeptidase)
VILGHLDSVEGPAVFARLAELRRGDRVIVRRANGSVVRFVVMRSVVYPNADFPAQRVYAAQGERRLNLITCAGPYDSSRGGYQANLVVYTLRAGATPG